MMKRMILWWLKILKYLSWLNQDFEKRYSESANKRIVDEYNTGKTYYKI